MAKIVAALFITGSLSLSSAFAAIEVPGGKIYQTTIRDTGYKFDHAAYSVFIPESATVIRGVFIHQHGCTMEGTGYPTAYDLQYQAFAKKWGLAIVGPDLYPKLGGNCDQWRNPEDGSGPALLAALDSTARFSGHAELKTAKWLLWGHSGGGYWVLAMIKGYSDRLLAAVAYSPAFDPTWTYPAAVSKLPILIRHAGSADFNDGVINCWGTALHTFTKLRGMNGYVSIAYTPGQNHNLSYLRYMAIPFYESVLAQRLPNPGSTSIKDMDTTKAWLGDTATHQVFKLSGFNGNKLAMSWLPDSNSAAKWSEYVTTSTVADKTPPPAPTHAAISTISTTSIALSWKANGDIESGIKYFNIYQNNKFLKRFPAAIDFQTFNTNGDDCSPVTPPALICSVAALTAGKIDTFAISTVNKFSLESPKIVVRNGSTGIALHGETTLLNFDATNPFYPTTTISFGLQGRGFVRLAIYTVDGRRITLLAEGNIPEGNYRVKWDANSCPAGLYLCSLELAGKKQFKKLVLTR